MAPPLVTDWRELDDRVGDGLEIRLWWSRSTGRVQVTVADNRRGDHFVVEVDGGAAMDAFRHPFAYAGRPQGAREHIRRSELSLAERREKR